MDGLLVEEPTIEMPEFMQYYPSKESMNSEQAKYYKYWLSEWLNNRPKKADTSYIFVYVYDLIQNAIEDKRKLDNTVYELEKLSICYGKQVGSHISIWTTDILEYHQCYSEVFKRMANGDFTWSRTDFLNRFLNIKLILNQPLDGRDLFYIAKTTGTPISYVTRRHLDEAYKGCQNLLIDFQSKHGQEFLKYVKSNFPHIEKEKEYLLSGFPHVTSTPIEYISFLKNHFVINFAVNNVCKVDLGLKQKYQKRKTSKNIGLPKKALQKLWELEIYEPFANPSPDFDNKRCHHSYLRLKNHWETYRKYKCLGCDKVFMCACDLELVETARLHRRYQTSGEWLCGICPKCRGLEDTSFITDGKLMYGSTFYAKHWREIYFECDRLLADKSSWNLIEAENRVREKYGMPLIGEGWVSETTLFKTLKNMFKGHEVVHHASPEWLGKMHLDVYIPDLKIAFEYQGRQHLEPVEHFGGEVGFEATTERDKKKAKLCKENGVKLVYIYEGDDFSETTLRNHIIKMGNVTF